MYSMTQTKFLFLFPFEYQKHAEFYAGFQSVEKIETNRTQKKVFCQKLLHVTAVENVEEERKTPILHHVFAYNFL
jgi:hypothetical protein